MATDDKMIDALIGRMTLAEKIGQLTMASANMATTGPLEGNTWDSEIRDGTVGNLFNLFGPAETARVQAIAVEQSRLGIPLLMGFDVVHGHRTIFPIPLGEAAAFDPDLWERTARQAAAEASADGLNMTFAPMIDVARDPRWGRIAESAGEDHWVNSRFGVAKVRGFEGDDIADPTCVAGCAKHFAGYGAVTAGREYASAEVSERTMEEVYLPPFRAAVEAGVASIMPAFHDLAGIPMTAHVGLMRDRLRGGFGFTGVAVSDYCAITELIAHGIAADDAEAAAAALLAGVDIDMMGFSYARGLPVALSRGLVREADIDVSVRRVLELKLRLGLFRDPFARGATRAGAANVVLAAAELPSSGPAEVREPLVRNPSTAIGPRDYALAREAAARSMVVLVNDGVLPLDTSRGLGRLVVIGPIADDPGAVLGSWSGAGLAEEAVSYLAGLRKALPHWSVDLAPGVSVTGDDRSGIAAAAALAAGADVVVLCLGESAELNGEGASRLDPGLPGRQADLAAAVFDAGRPVITVLTAGRPLIAPIVFDRSAAVVMAFAPGTAAGDALADILTGRADPSGRLPVTWPAKLGQVPIYFGQRPTGRPPADNNRYSARYIDGPVAPLFPFGHGLSYTTFHYGTPVVDRTVLRRDETLQITVEVENRGGLAGRATVFIFTRDAFASVARPLLELRGAVQVDVPAGDVRHARLALAANDLMFLGHGLSPRFEPGTVEILAGASADRAKLLGVPVMLED